MSDEVGASPAAVNALKHKDGGTQQLNFTKLYSPKMKSVYWRYFGFPSNNNNEVITKQNVVCIKCHKVLTNHGNTTNLRAHLQHRHKDLFKELCEEHDIHVPTRKTPRNLIHPPLSKRNITTRRVKLEFINNRNNQDSGASDDEMDEAAVATAAMQAEEESSSSHTLLYETMVPLTYEDSDNQVDEEEEEPKFQRKVGKVGRPLSIKHEDGGGGYSSPNIPNLAEALLDIVIRDVRNVETLYDAGFSDFIRQAMGGNAAADMPHPEKIDSLLTEMHTSKFLELGYLTRAFSAEKPFSLAFERWVNVEQRRFLTIYHHYLDAETQSVRSAMYATVEYNDYIVFDDLLATDFHLSNCTLVIINYDDQEDLLYSYLKEKNIPVVLCYVSVIDKCLLRVFDIEEVSSLLEQVKDIMQRHSAEISTKVSAELPSYNENFPWTLYEMLKFFVESISWSEDMDQLVLLAKTVTDALSALVIALDTLKGEDIPLCSMLSPITSKILIKKLAIGEQDDTLMVNIKRTIAGVLQSYVIFNDNLTSAALLDPRFHRLTTIANLDRCVRMLSEKYNKMFGGSNGTEVAATTTSVNTSPTVNIKIEAGNSTNFNIAKKSKLELLFDVAEFPNRAKRDAETVETDLKRYRNEVIVKLDESPINWWHKMGHVYATLCDLASLYQSVPGVVTLSFKKTLREQIYEFNKRSMLTGNQIDAILFLNHHS